MSAPIVRPTLAHPRDERPEDRTVLTLELEQGDRVLTSEGPREVVAVENGPAGGWRVVRFAPEGRASVVLTQPWILEPAEVCGSVDKLKGQWFSCDRSPDHGGRHESFREGELVARWEV